MKRVLVFGFLLNAVLAQAQRTNVQYVNHFPGGSVGAKISAAQAACHISLPCVIIIDSELAGYTQGTMPSRCAHCAWYDYRTLGALRVASLFSSTMFDVHSTFIRTWIDPNGGGPGAPANRQAAFIMRGRVSANDATSVANHMAYIGGELDCHPTLAIECNYLIVYPIISRGNAADSLPELNGVAIGAPIAPVADTSTATASMVSTFSVESNPPITWCTGASGSDVKLTRLGVCAFSLRVMGGPSLFRSSLNFYNAGSGINQLDGDLILQNLDSSAAGTFSYYNAGSLKMRIQNSGATSITNALRIGDRRVPNSTLDVVGNARIAGSVSSGSNGSTLLYSNSAPTISSGFGTSPSISANNGTGAFRVSVGTGGAASSGVIGLPKAETGWHCTANNITTNTATVFMTKQTASTTTTVTIGNFNTSGAPAAWAASDTLLVSCFAF
jgi:hypothetical protein